MRQRANSSSLRTSNRANSSPLSIILFSSAAVICVFSATVMLRHIRSTVQSFFAATAHRGQKPLEVTKPPRGKSPKPHPLGAA